MTINQLSFLRENDQIVRQAWSPPPTSAFGPEPEPMPPGSFFPEKTSNKPNNSTAYDEEPKFFVAVKNENRIIVNKQILTAARAGEVFCDTRTWFEGLCRMTHISNSAPRPARTAAPAPTSMISLSENQGKNERRTWFVIWLTLVTMVVEIISGWVFGSMALLADGWHMASHASALGITVLGYRLAKKHRDNRKFTFGTGKIGDLAGFSSALLLVFVAIFMAYESIDRLLNPMAIGFNQAILVAVVGLVVNLASAFILKEQPHDHGHGHRHDHGHDSDHNLRAAYLHVLADALTSVLAIAALALGKLFNWTFLDPLMGIVGALVIARWSYGLLLETGRVLLDYETDHTVRDQVLELLGGYGDIQVEDLHVWRLGPGHYSAIIAVRSDGDHQPDELKSALCRICHLSHVTVELNPSATSGNHPATTRPKKT